MGFFVPILDQSSKLTCAICGQRSRSGVSIFYGRCKVGCLCHTCAGQPRDPLLPVSLRVNGWPAFAICLTAIAAAAVVFLLNGLVWAATRTLFF
jgi:hypothetical protein